MFGFGKGGKRVALVKELVETRLRLRGQDEIQSRLFVKSLGTLSAMSLPEGTIVSIIEAAVDGQKKGVLLKDVLMRQETLRRMLGSDPSHFEAILAESAGPNPAGALMKYCQYRNGLEAMRNPNAFLNEEELMALLPIAYKEIARW